jgi:hypothetical protein
MDEPTQEPSIPTKNDASVPTRVNCDAHPLDEGLAIADTTCIERSFL